MIWIIFGSNILKKCMTFILPTSHMCINLPGYSWDDNSNHAILLPIQSLSIQIIGTEASSIKQPCGKHVPRSLAACQLALLPVASHWLVIWSTPFRRQVAMGQIHCQLIESSFRIELEELAPVIYRNKNHSPPIPVIPKQWASTTHFQYNTETSGIGGHRGGYRYPLTTLSRLYPRVRSIWRAMKIHILFHVADVPGLHNRPVMMVE